MNTPNILEEMLGIPGAPPQTATSWWILFSGDKPRLYIPTQSSARKAALSFLNRRWKACLLEFYLPWSGLFGKPAQITGGNHSPLQQITSEVFPDIPLVFAAYCGSDSIFAKYTLQCIDPDGCIVGYVKVAQQERANTSIQNEIEIISKLSTNPELQPHIPKILWNGEHNGKQICIQSAPTGTSISAPEFPNTNIAQFSKKLFSVQSSMPTWKDSPLRSRVMKRAEAISMGGEKESAALIQDAVEKLDRLFQDITIPHGMSHGDFVAWNMRLAPELYIFDWEWAAPRTPFYDLYHYYFSVALKQKQFLSLENLIQKFNRSEWLSVLQKGAPEELPFAPSDAIWWKLYLLEAYAFYAEASVSYGDKLSKYEFILRLGRYLKESL